MDKVMQILEMISSSSLFWGVVALVIAAITLSGRFSLRGADTVLLTAWLIAIVGIFRGKPVSDFQLIPRILTTMLCVSILGLGFYRLSLWFHTQKVAELIDTKLKADLPELEKRFPGGFQMFAVAIGGGAMGGHNIIRSPTSYSIDITWDNAAITELTSDSLTLQLQNIRITRTETTPGGTQPAGGININGAAIWRIDRGTKLVYINNAIAFWGYVLGGYVLIDTNDVLLIAIGLQKVE